MSSLFNKVNQNWLFAGDESDDNVKDHVTKVIVGWYSKIRITLSTVASSVNKLIKTTSKSSLYFDVLATMILCLQLARVNLCLRYKNVEYRLKI